MSEQWSDEQAEAVLDEAWATGSARCPLDGSPLSVVDESSAVESFRRVTCPECGRTASTQRAPSGIKDHRSSDFRAWTDADRKLIAEQHAMRGELRCPVDGAGLVVHSMAIGDERTLRIECHRCGQIFVRQTA
jgi:transposase-like protein